LNALSKVALLIAITPNEHFLQSYYSFEREEFLSLNFWFLGNL